VADLRQQIDAYHHQKETATALNVEQRDLLLQTFGDSLYWEALTHEEKRDIYRALVDRVIIKDGQVERVDLRV